MSKRRKGRCIGCRHPSGSVCGGCGSLVDDGWDGEVAVPTRPRVVLKATDIEEIEAKATLLKGCLAEIDRALRSIGASAQTIQRVHNLLIFGDQEGAAARAPATTFPELEEIFDEVSLLMNPRPDEVQAWLNGFKRAWMIADPSRFPTEPPVNETTQGPTP